MSFWTTNREDIHMTRMENASQEANVIEQLKEEELCRHHLQMEHFREEELKNQVFTLTLKGDEARDYNDWKGLRHKHKELVKSALVVLSVAKFIDELVTKGPVFDMMTGECVNIHNVKGFTEHVIKDVSKRLFPLLGNNVFTGVPSSQEDMKEFIDRIVAN